ncbi:uncharacterized protein LOC125671381 isoform X2 [Ostrea edulis]|uniref:uncharacterized protein LOC125671381 isoform X2 n=1 Tax=Ostrea edulis TaxID=37623 RepID=UPI0024AF129C|nr:uncharacterized protein LOC125671381 isoform X2 [Ostrea edulis]
MARCIYPLVILAACIGLAFCDVLGEIQELKKGQKEMKNILREIQGGQIEAKNMFKEILSKLSDHSKHLTSSPPEEGSRLPKIQELKKGQKEMKNVLREIQDGQIDKWYEPGGYIVSLSKTTSGDDVKLELEMSLAPSTVVTWGVNDGLVEANASTFGTSSKRLKKTTLYTIHVKAPVESLYFVTFSVDDVITNYKLNVTAEDGTTRYTNPTICQPAFTQLSDNSYEAIYRCKSELDSRDSWYMDVGLYRGSDSEGDIAEFKMLDTKKNQYVNLTIERNTTATATVVFSDEVIEKFRDFLFLFSSLTKLSGGVLTSTTYRIVHDISKTKTAGEFKFYAIFSNMDRLEGEKIPILCEAMGRNPPPIKVERNGEIITESDGVSAIQSTSRIWSTSYVTFLHASKQLEGNYTCVTENQGKRVVSPRYIQVEIKPRIVWSLTKTLVNEQYLKSVLIVVDGAKGLSLTCSNTSQGNVTLANEKRSPLSEWNERVENEYTWTTQNTETEESYFEYTPFVSCIAKDKNGEIKFDHVIW